MRSIKFSDSASERGIIRIATDHQGFSSESYIRWLAGHESLHNAGLTHPKYTGYEPYRFGNGNEKRSYENLGKFAPQKRYTNPDYVMSEVYK